jgi:hypothetical protein
VRILLLALQGFRSDPVKSLLTVVALTLGMLGLVSIVAAQSVLAQSVTQRALAQGGPTATYSVSVSGALTPVELSRFATQLRIATGADAAAAAIDDSDVALTASDGRRVDATVRFVDDGLWHIRRAHLSSGSWLGVLPATLAVPLLLNDTATASSDSGAFAIASQGVAITASVAGVIDDGETAAVVYAPLADATRFVGGKGRTRSVQLTGGELTHESVVGAVARLRSFGVDAEVSEISRTDTVDQLRRELATTGNVLFALGALSLVAAVTAVANVGLATARVRAREYALRRTLGASRRQIALATVVESQLTGLIAAAVSAGAAWLLFPLMLGLFDPPQGLDVPGFSLEWVALCVVVASGASLLAGLVPAAISFRRDNSAVMRE